MIDFDDVPAVGTGENLFDDIARWVDSPPMRAVVSEFAGDSPFDWKPDLAERLQGLDEFSARWDTRKGKERDLAEDLPLTGDQEDLVLSAARALGFRASRPPLYREYDHVMLLGGLFRACITRPAHAANLLREGVVTTTSVVALGGFRPFGEQETQLAIACGFPGLTEEFEALDAGTRRAFDLPEPISEAGETFDDPGSSWGVREYDEPSGTRVRVAAAPSSEPKARRANTADSYGWFATKLAQLERGSRILAVTTAIYVPAQQAAALRMLNLEFGVDVDTVGIEPGDVVPELAQPFTPTKYLLEIRSTIRALRDLHAQAWPVSSN